MRGPDVGRDMQWPAGALLPVMALSRHEWGERLGRREVFGRIAACEGEYSGQQVVCLKLAAGGRALAIREVDQLSAIT